MMNVRSSGTNRAFITAAYTSVGLGLKTQPVVVNSIEIGPQRNGWSCGPSALRYCLAAYGIDVDDRRIAMRAGTTRAGTDEYMMAQAARTYGFRFDITECRTAYDAKQTVLSSLKRNQPVIVCVDSWEHWIAVLAHSPRGFLVFDSSRPGPVIQRHSWKWLQKNMQLKYNNKPRWQYKGFFKNDKRNIYCVWALRPVQDSWQ